MSHSPDDPFTQPSNGSQPPMPQPEFPQAPPPEPGFHSQPQDGQPQYAQPQYTYGPDPRTQKNWMGITALVLSLASLVTGFTAIGGIIFGHLSVAAAKRGEADNGGLGRAGMIIGYVLTILSILAIVGFFLLIGVAATQSAVR